MTSAPSPAAGREPAIDMIRGVALFGILVVNMPFFAMPFGFAGDWWRSAFPGALDWFAVFLIQALFEAKFILIFSFLFGYGAARQIAANGAGRYRRRLLALGMLGVAHALLLFAGDILLAYALLGMILPFAAGWSVVRRLKAAALMWLLAILTHTLLAIIGIIEVEPLNTGGNAAVAVHRSADFLGIARYRLFEWAVFYGLAPFSTLPHVAAMFFLGMAAFRHLGANSLSSLAGRGAAMARLLWLPALVGNVVYAAAAMAPPGAAKPAFVAVELILRGVFPPLLSLVLIGAGLSLFSSPLGARIGRIFQADGRLSLSLYICESIACALIFLGYGLGLYGRIGPAACIGLAVLVYFGLLIAASLWSRVFAKGPFEWFVERMAGPRRPPRMALETAG
ncbi:MULTISPECIES: DUF418 domain-containing protein [unclassified Bosea (in: a-proteobacteria)]|uniref:DUF418 domain-containing protein n=1 Tax=unclassified Bosea (in: a-proteobacteria) TaxID=2653178 RepID=UPI000F758104|nr:MULTISPECIES: DUF418 domain-containing protein [unclassified Bosea (in: a-proteobacteria)]AZO80850.1 hypothetical protein BLM15_27245 [Bosea sp. Tri-49]RXT25814.1 hypothetical protein B5U98_04405 [Bosea sp. Tri-39]RXT31056.1 hypothetical protein B5U99_19950 [Bosea sp. Tri-54]